PPRAWREGGGRSVPQARTPSGPLRGPTDERGEVTEGSSPKESMTFFEREPSSGRSPWPLRDPRSVGGWRDGGGLPRAGRSAQARGGGQGPAGDDVRGWGAPSALRAGGASRQRLEPSQHSLGL